MKLFNIDEYFEVKTTLNTLSEKYKDDSETFENLIEKVTTESEIEESVVLEFLIENGTKELFEAKAKNEDDDCDDDEDEDEDEGEDEGEDDEEVDEGELPPALKKAIAAKKAKAKGGDDSDENLQSVCKPCDELKTNSERNA